MILLYIHFTILIGYNQLKIMKLVRWMVRYSMMLKVALHDIRNEANLMIGQGQLYPAEGRTESACVRSTGVSWGVCPVVRQHPHQKCKFSAPP